MITDSQILQDRISAGATARLDRGFAEPGSDEWNLENWLHLVAGRIGVAISRRIPVGFENETGFHLGVQSACEEHSMAWERVGILVDDEHF